MDRYKSAPSRERDAQSREGDTMQVPDSTVHFSSAEGDFSVVRGGRDRGREKCGQASKGVWGMSWHSKAKGVDKLRKARGSC
jgi:hypothetical protein